VTMQLAHDSSQCALTLFWCCTRLAISFIRLLTMCQGAVLCIEYFINTVRTDCGQSWRLKFQFSRPGKLWNQA